MNEKTKKLLYLVFYVFLFAYIFFIFNKKDDIAKKIIDPKGEQVIMVKNYAYSCIVNENIELTGKVYGLKSLITKKENNIETYYYLNDKDLYIKNGDYFEKHDGSIIEGLDINIIDIQYLDSLLEKEYEIREKTDNTLRLYIDSEKVELNLYYDENKDLDKMDINKGDFNIEIRHYDKDKIKDFEVDIK